MGSRAKPERSSAGLGHEAFQAARLWGWHVQPDPRARLLSLGACVARGGAERCAASCRSCACGTDCALGCTCRSHVFACCLVACRTGRYWYNSHYTLVTPGASTCRRLALKLT